MALVIEGEERIAAPLQKVWEALNDPEVLKATIPGCKSLDMKSPTEMTATVVLKIGPIKATFNGAVPEPGTWMMMLLGFGAMGVAMRRDRKKLAAA